MRKKLLMYFAAAIIMLGQIASAATIHGTVYDDTLSRLKGVLLEINTEPKQTFVSSDGEYSFNVPNGRYTLKAEQIDSGTVKLAVEEDITIKNDGDFVVDLVLLPLLNEEPFAEDDITTGEIGLDKSDNGINNGIILAAAGTFAAIAVLAIIVIMHMRKKRTVKEEARECHEEDGLESVMQAIRKAGGRITQKELRKQFPLSEAKVSLMIAELEHKGKLTKIKKGRGNILILNK